MNANSTLTGGVITFSVSYSSSTSKFTIDAGTGHTIALTYAGSDAALTFGFDSDKSAAQTITSDNTVPGDPSDVVQDILNGVDEWVKEYCHRDFEETTYTKEEYDGTGDVSLFLNQYPVTGLTRVSIGRVNAIMVNNSSSDATSAYVTVSSTGITLTVNGGTNNGEDTLSFSTYTTMQDLVDAINALSKGWQAELLSNNYADYKSTELIPKYGAYCGSGAGWGETWAYLEMPDKPLSDFKLYPDRGEIYYSGGFPEGHKNIIVDYTAGYTSSTMPNDLNLAVKIAVKFLYQKREEESFGLKDYSLGFVKQSFADILPSEVLNILDRYRRRIIA